MGQFLLSTFLQVYNSTEVMLKQMLSILYYSDNMYLIWNICTCLLDSLLQHKLY